MRILFNDSQGLKILIPAPDLDPLLVAEKDVPAGILFKIVDDSELPQNREFRNAWTYAITKKSADGKGLTKEEFDAKYPTYDYMAVVE